MIETLLKNRYQLGERIGIGGMAYVYEGEDTLLRRKVAIKILKQDYAEDEDFLRKFENEALSVASLSHGHIVNVYDVGHEMIDERMLHYIVMEYIDGKTLKERIRLEGALPNKDIARIGKQIAQALRLAHEHNIVHRDIKPANILFTANGDVKVADFGIARISSTATITYTNSILGTVHYISPEQAKGRFIDQKSDLYSLGVLMYEMATGKVPFDAENSVGIAIKHIQEEPIPPIELNPNLAPGLNSIILRLLKKEPADRYANADELMDALSNYQNYNDTVLMDAVTEQATERVPVVKSREATYVSKPDFDEMDDEASAEAKRRWPFYFGLGVIAVISAILLIFFISRHVERRLAEDTTTVPTVINLTEEEALKLLEERHLKGVIKGRYYNDTIAEGKVIDQSIREGTPVDRGTEINLVLSMGKENNPVPKVQGLSTTDAISKLEAAGFKIAPLKQAFSSSIEKGKVIETDPKEGDKVKPNTMITIIESNGPAVTIPKFSGMSQQSAEETVKRLKLKLSSIKREFSGDVAEGEVISQSLAAGDVVAEGTAIELVVSKGEESRAPETVSVPSLLNMTETAALNAITNANLSIGPIERRSSGYPAGTVIAQSVASGVRVEAKTAISITVSTGDEPEQLKMVSYKLSILTDGQASEYKVVVTDTSVSPAEVLLEQTYSKSDLNSENLLDLSVRARVNAKLKITINGRDAHFDIK